MVVKEGRKNAGRKMFSVALIGADGAGKTTVARHLEAEQLLPIRYLYMGVSKRSSNRMLPTTRLLWALKQASGRDDDEGGPPDPSQKRRPARGWRRLAVSARRTILLANRMAEEWYRLLLATLYRYRGYIVIFDRHFYTDYYAHDIATNDSRSLARRIHGLVLNRLYPKPDLLILLDAPASVLYDRKREGTVELLERRRAEYWQLQDQVPHFRVVDASQPQEVVVREVTELVRNFHQQQQTGGTTFQREV
jgi:thymidylate kinase